MVKSILCAVLALPLSVFFAFVGWHKAFSPIAELAKHGAFTVHLPEYLGRLFGVTEMLCALALLVGIAPRWRAAAKCGAVYVFFSQIVAGAIHVIYGEMQALPANAQWMAIAAALFAVCAWKARADGFRDELA